MPEKTSYSPCAKHNAPVSDRVWSDEFSASLAASALPNSLKSWSRLSLPNQPRPRSQRSLRRWPQHKGRVAPAQHQRPQCQCIHLHQSQLVGPLPELLPQNQREGPSAPATISQQTIKKTMPNSPFPRRERKPHLLLVLRELHVLPARRSTPLLRSSHQRLTMLGRHRKRARGANVDLHLS
jgi:hypothetical protein